jgi:hypothetical protein
MTTAPQPLFDMSKAMPIQAAPAQGTPLFDMSKAQPIGGGAATTDIPSGHWLSATGDVLADLAKGFGKGALQTVTSTSRLLNAIPGVGETLAPSAGVQAMRQVATPTDTTQKIGAGIEQGAELLLPTGEAGLAAKIGVGALKGGASVAAHEGGTTQGVSLGDVALGAGIGGAAPAVAGGIQSALGSKFARGMVNESVMATPRDVVYGNPAKALLDERIANPATGDLEKFKDAIRSGATLQGAADAAGGRIAAISGKINQLGPQLRSILASSPARIPASTVTDPIDAGIQAISRNRGVTAQDAQAAIAELQAMKQAALKVPTVPGASATAWAPLEANTVKQEIGGNINWEGRERVGELVDPVRKQVYSALRDAVNAADPTGKVAALNERLTNLYAAQADVNKLAGFEEIGRGRSMGGVIGPSWMGRIEALAGRYIPALSWLTPGAAAAAKATAIPAMTGFRLSDLLGQ